ncbi:hypothetical protein F5Y11DRAFT_350744 [Daldinia sp. FL1419]|nr:hypothetical protein F5Y11DRAFT_350744 [Daldinia sp. FL1419]
MQLSIQGTVLPVPSDNRGHFTSLPYDVRLRIYEIIFEDFVLDSSVVLGLKEKLSDKLEQYSLLHTCRQTRNDVIPLFFNKLYINSSHPDWYKFLDVMGPDKLSFVQRLIITYKCRSSYKHLADSDPPDWGVGSAYHDDKVCNGSGCREPSLKEHDEWADIFKCLKEARPSLQLLGVLVKPCICNDTFPEPLEDGGDEDEDEDEDDGGDSDYFTDALEYDEDEDEDEYSEEDDGEDGNGFTSQLEYGEIYRCRWYGHCWVYNDINIQRHLLFFNNARMIVLGGRFNPLWSLLLAREHGSTVKRWAKVQLMDSTDHYYIENLNPEYQMDLKGFKESKNLKGVYYEDVEGDPKNWDWGKDEYGWQNAAERVGTEAWGKDETIEKYEFTSDRDDGNFDWKFPNFWFRKEVVPRIRQDSSVEEST